MRPILYSALVSHLLLSIRRAVLMLIAVCCVSSAKAQKASPYDAALSTRIDSSPLLPFKERQLPLHANLHGWTLGAISGVAIGQDGYIYVVQRGADADPILVFDLSGISFAHGDEATSPYLTASGSTGKATYGPSTLELPRSSSIPLPVPSFLRSASRLCRIRAARSAALPTLRLLQTEISSSQMDTGTVGFWSTRQEAGRCGNGGTPVRGRVTFICPMPSRSALAERYTLRTGRTAASNCLT